MAHGSPAPAGGPLFGTGRMSLGGEAGDRHTAGRATVVVQAALVTEHRGRRLATVLGADAAIDLRVRGTGALHCADRLV